jgi:gliding motility-associated-like protein
MKNLLKPRFAMQIRKALFILLIALGFTSARSQGIVLNEVSVSGNNFANAYVNPPDWVELYNNWNLPLSLNGYYLSDDKNNLYKWKCPNITLTANSFTVFCCTGYNKKEPSPSQIYHTNFTFEQCKNEILLLTYNGAIKDSISVRRTKPGDTRGRVPDGLGPWKVLTTPGGPTPGASNAGASSYIDYAIAPTFSTAPGWTVPAGGFYDMWIPDTVNYQINYTLDGTVPCANTLGCPGPAPAPITYPYYDNIQTPIAPSGVTQVIRAITIPTGTYEAANYLPSFCETNTYFDGPDLTVNNGFGVISVCVDTVSFFNTATTQTCHVEYYDKMQFWSEGDAFIYQPLNDGWLNWQRGYGISMIDERAAGCAINGQVFNDNVFGVSTRTFFPDFEVRAAGKDNFSMLGSATPTSPPPTGAHMRDAFAQTYAMQIGLNMDGMHYKPIRSYFNGVYRGIYEFREIPNWEYVKYYHNQDKDSSEILAVHAPFAYQLNGITDTGWVTTPMSGASVNNSGTFNYIKTFPVDIKGNPYYTEAMKRLDQKSFMDFWIYNSFLVNVDITNYNFAWWRGTSLSDQHVKKWRYFMWDMNNILDIDAVPQTLSTSNMSVSPCVYTSTNAISQSGTTYSTVASNYTGHGYLLYKLLKNQDFRDDYLNRYMDLLNTSLRCDKMLAHLNYFRTMFTPEMSLHQTVWLVQQPDWEANMDTLKSRLTTRCNMIQKELGAQGCQNFKGPFTITIDVKPEGAGTVDFNSLHLTTYPWSGSYYQRKSKNYLLSFLEAAPIDTNYYVFDHWEFTSSTNSVSGTPDIKTANTGYYASDSLTFEIHEGDMITAVFADKRTDVVLPTGFTPNADGVNDWFIPLGPAGRFARDYEFQIFNRWGQEVFRTTDYTMGWDGRHAGTEAQTGVYAYMVKYKNVLNESKIVKGNVTLIR